MQECGCAYLVSITAPVSTLQTLLSLNNLINAHRVGEANYVDARISGTDRFCLAQNIVLKDLCLSILHASSCRKVVSLLLEQLPRDPLCRTHHMLLKRKVYDNDSRVKFWLWAYLLSRKPQQTSSRFYA